MADAWGGALGASWGGAWGYSESSSTPTPVKGRGKRYIVEVDGEFFPVASQSEAFAMLDQLRELAEESAQRDAQSAKPVPRVRIKSGEIGDTKPVTNKAIKQAVRNTQQAIDNAYAKTAELIARSSLRAEIRKEVEQSIRDEYEALIALLL